MYKARVFTRKMYFYMCTITCVFTDKSLPTDLSLSQLIQVLQQQGLPQGQSVLEFGVKVSSKSKDTIPGNETWNFIQNFCEPNAIEP